jgi:hypothetical protein
MERRNVRKVSRHQTLLLNGKGKATLHVVPSKWLYTERVTPPSQVLSWHTPALLSKWWTLWATILTINHKLNVSGHTLIRTLFLGLVRGTRVRNLCFPFSYTLLRKLHNSVLNVARSCKEMSLFVRAWAMKLLTPIRERTAPVAVGMQSALTEGFLEFETVPLYSAALLSNSLRRLTT